MKGDISTPTSNGTRGSSGALDGAGEPRRGIRTENDERARELLSELQHRVRNALAVVRSIARRTADRSRTVEEMISHFDGRLNAFARVQSAVFRSTAGQVGLQAIVEDELLAVATREGGQLRIKGPTVWLSSKTAEIISLAVHELATNAVKFGALSHRTGRIDIHWQRRPDQLRLEWVERGVPEQPHATQEGFGHELLRRTIPYDLGAETDIQFTGDGIRFIMRLPLGSDVLAEEA